MLLRELDVEITEEFGQNIKRQMKELGLTEEDHIDVILDEQDYDYPENVDELMKKWELGGVNGLKVGDRVLLKYIMNTDGTFCGFAYRGAEGIVAKIYGNNMIEVKFDSDELNQYENLWCPYSFKKIED